VDDILWRKDTQPCESVGSVRIGLARAFGDHAQRGRIALTSSAVGSLARAAEARRQELNIVLDKGVSEPLTSLAATSRVQGQTGQDGR